MDAPQPHSLFSTAELFRAVIRQVDHPKTLARCACVNKRWRDESIPILWKGNHDQDSVWATPHVAHLTKLAKFSDSFRYYISLVDKLVLLHGSRRIDLLADILFQPSLWAGFAGSMVLVDLGSNNMKEEFMRVLIQPALRSLSLFGGYYSNEFLQYLDDTCALRLLLIDDRACNIGAQALQRCIERHPLEYLELQQGFEDVVNTAICSLVLKKPTVQHFCTSCTSISFPYQIIDGAPSNLRSLDLRSFNPVVPPVRNLFQHLPNLESFSIDILGRLWDVGQELLRPIVVCRHLRELYVCMDADGDGSQSEAADFLNFAQKCPLIDTIDINGARSYELPSSQIVTAIALWPNLMSLSFSLPLTLISKADISAISKRCPKLRRMAFKAKIAMDAFEVETFSFPLLSSIKFGGTICDPAPSSPTEHGRLIKNMRSEMLLCMPRLDFIEVSTFTTYSTDGVEYPPYRGSYSMATRVDKTDDVIETEPQSVRRAIELQIEQA